MNFCAEKLRAPVLAFEDASAYFYLYLRAAGYNKLSDVKQVVVDEAQDYDPLHYEILGLLFPNAKYTVLGDVNQSIEKQADVSLYDEVERILHKKRTTKVFLTKSFRCSYEINAFSAHILGQELEIESFDRHESAPLVVRKESTRQLDDAVVQEIQRCMTSGLESAAVVCKNMRQARKLYEGIGQRLGARLLDETADAVMSGIVIAPVYMVKGLEFDAVVVYEAGAQSYSSEDDRKLLYVACTRALHRLSVFYTGDPSPFLPKSVFVVGIHAMDSDDWYGPLCYWHAFSRECLRIRKRESAAK